MNAEQRQHLVDLFLEGRMKGGAPDDFPARIRSEKELCRDLESASAFEAAFYSLSWGLAAEGTTAASPENDIARAEQYSKQDWQSLIAAAFAAADRARPTARGRILIFPGLGRYLAAACLAAAVAGAGALMWRQVSIGRDQPRIVAIGRTLEDTIRPAVPGKKGDSVVTRIAFDSIIVYSMQDAAEKPVRPAGNDGILRLGDKTAVLLEKNSSIEVRQRLDSAVTLDMQYGSALFTVEKKRYHDFRIYTPESEIAVTGTVFRVRAEKDTTIVSVKEGSVDARRENDTGYVAIPAGMSGFVTSAGIVLACGDSAATLPYKRGLLRDFLEENGVWENGCFIRAGLPSYSDSTATHETNK